MFSSAGYFRSANCPFFVHGLCHRPYCHFRHAKPGHGNSSKTLSHKVRTKGNSSKGDPGKSSSESVDEPSTSEKEVKQSTGNNHVSALQTNKVTSTCIDTSNVTRCIKGTKDKQNMVENDMYNKNSPTTRGSSLLDSINKLEQAVEEVSASLHINKPKRLELSSTCSHDNKTTTAVAKNEYHTVQAEKGMLEVTPTQESTPNVVKHSTETKNDMSIKCGHSTSSVVESVQDSIPSVVVKQEIHSTETADDTPIKCGHSSISVVESIQDSIPSVVKQEIHSTETTNDTPSKCGHISSSSVVESIQDSIPSVVIKQETHSTETINDTPSKCGHSSCSVVELVHDSIPSIVKQEIHSTETTDHMSSKCDKSPGSHSHRSSSGIESVQDSIPSAVVKQEIHSTVTTDHVSSKRSKRPGSHSHRSSSVIESVHDSIPSVVVKQEIHSTETTDHISSKHAKSPGSLSSVIESVQDSIPSAVVKQEIHSTETTDHTSSKRAKSTGSRSHRSSSVIESVQDSIASVVVKQEIHSTETTDHMSSKRAKSPGSHSHRSSSVIESVQDSIPSVVVKQEKHSTVTTDHMSSKRSKRPGSHSHRSSSVIESVQDSIPSVVVKQEIHSTETTDHTSSKHAKSTGSHNRHSSSVIKSVQDSIPSIVVKQEIHSTETTDHTSSKSANSTGSRSHRSSSVIESVQGIVGSLHVLPMPVTVECKKIKSEKHQVVIISSSDDDGQPPQEIQHKSYVQVNNTEMKQRRKHGLQNSSVQEKIHIKKAKHSVDSKSKHIPYDESEKCSTNDSKSRKHAKKNNCNDLRSLDTKAKTEKVLADVDFFTTPSMSKKARKSNKPKSGGKTETTEAMMPSQLSCTIRQKEKELELLKLRASKWKTEKGKTKLVKKQSQKIEDKSLDSKKIRDSVREMLRPEAESDSDDTIAERAEYCGFSDSSLDCDMEDTVTDQLKEIFDNYDPSPVDHHQSVLATARKQYTKSVSCSASQSSASKSSVKRERSSSTSDMQGLELGKKQRVAHEPKHLVQRLSSNANPIRRYPKTITASSRKGTSTQSNTDRPASSSLNTTYPQTKQRIAHAAKTNTGCLPRPRLPVEYGAKVPQNHRQRYLDKLIDEHLRLCSSEREAFSKALEEEHFLYERATRRHMYVNFCINAIKKLRSMPTPEPVLNPPSPLASSRSIASVGKSGNHGTMEQGNHDGQKKNTFENLTEEMFYDLLYNYLLDEDGLVDNGYPRPSLSSGKVVFKSRKKKTPNSSDSTRRTCHRCGKPYTVLEDGSYTRQEECVHHVGKLLRRRVAGEVNSTYSCCDGDTATPGCAVAKVHVSEGKSVTEGFMTTIVSPLTGNNKKVFSIDCEMCYTIDGLELTRATVVDWKLGNVYDTFVNPDNPVLDYNTRFSGVTEDCLRGVSTSIREVQAVLLSMIHKDTILVGHSLESDLIALKLVHSTVVDTSVVFPHRLGPPYKRALRNLTAEHLKQIIQDSEAGHDSYEDAKACLQLMLHKAKDDLRKKERQKRSSNIL